MDVERHDEIVRQWNILKQISTAADWTVNSLAQDHNCCRKTIERDLDALQYAGFPLYTVRVGRSNCWRMDREAFPGLKDTAFTFAELCAFYVNRARLASSGSPLDDDLQSAIQKLAKSLSPKMQQYLDKLAGVMVWKPEPGKRRADVDQHGHQEVIVKAILEHRAIEMTYHSLSSRRVKTYQVEPYRLTAGNGGLYLYAFVPEYAQMRSFALHRIKQLRILERTFSPVTLTEGPFDASIGVFTGKAEQVVLHFTASLAPYIEEGQWRPKQKIARQPDGSLVLTMDVSIDYALKSWILGFGHQVCVIEPKSLAGSIREELDEAREQYNAMAKFALPWSRYDDHQIRLPLQSDRSDGRPRPSSSRRSSADRT